MSLADSSINDRLVFLCPLIDQTGFEFINVSNLVVYYFPCRMFNTAKLVNHVLPSVKLM